MAYETRTVTAIAIQASTVPGREHLGLASEVTITVPTDLPTADRAEYLRALWTTHVKCGEHWKGPCYANVPEAIADDVAEAMEFMGAIVDSRDPITTGGVALFSKGYWAHGF